MKADVTITVDIPDEWLEDALAADTFSWYCIGYWGRGILIHAAASPVWAIEEELEVGDTVTHPDELRARWLTGEDLPRGYHVWDEAAAIAVYGEGVKRYGVNWYTEADCFDILDALIQHVLLGKVVYG